MVVLNGEKRAGLVLQCIGEMVKRRGVGMNDDIKAMASSITHHFASLWPRTDRTTFSYHQLTVRHWHFLQLGKYSINLFVLSPCFRGNYLICVKVLTLRRYCVLKKGI